MKHLLFRNIFLFLLLFVAAIDTKAQGSDYLHEGRVWIYDISSMDFLARGCRKRFSYEDYSVMGSKEINGRTYWNVKFYRTKDDGNCGEMPDSCYYLVAHPNPQTHPSYIGIREDNGRWLVDKDEYLGLISDTCWWRYVGDACFVPYEDTGDGELVLYDFNKQVGDVYGYAEGHALVIVDAVDYLETGDGIRRRLLTLSNGYRIVEGIGCINSPGLLLFYLNPRHSLLDFAILKEFDNNNKWLYYQSFEEMAETAVTEYEKKSVQLDCPDDNHPHAIDLGLPSGLRWACCNIGAVSPTEEGNLFAWGETEEKESYEYKNYWFHYQMGDSKYDFSETGLCISGTQYDAAHVIWGGGWHTPTVEESEELIHCCSHELVINRLAKGLKVTGPSGKSIFFSFTFDHAGRLWTGNRYPFDQNFANTLFYTDTPAKYVYIMNPYVGMPIRPVYEDLSGTHVSSKMRVNGGDSSSAIYNIIGIKVADSIDNLSGLPTGIYIQHGKKYLK